MNAALIAFEIERRGIHIVSDSDSRQSSFILVAILTMSHHNQITEAVANDTDLEKTLSKHPEAVDAAYIGAEPADYLEFLTLNDHFQGDALKKLTVSVRFFYSRRPISDSIAQDRLERHSCAIPHLPVVIHRSSKRR